MINDLLTPDSGTITLGTNVEIGYYDQEHHVLHMEKTLFEEIQDEYPNMTNTETVSYTHLIFYYLFISKNSWCCLLP